MQRHAKKQKALCSSNPLLLVCAFTTANSSGGSTCGSCSAFFGCKNNSNNGVPKDANSLGLCKVKSIAVGDTVLLGVRWGDTHQKGRTGCQDCNCYTPQYITANDLEVMESILFMVTKLIPRFSVFLLAKFGCI